MRAPLGLAIVCAALAVVPAAWASRGMSVHCTPSGHLCHAEVSLKGGASNLHVHIVLPAHGVWRGPSVRPSSHALIGAYNLSHGHLSGSSYDVTLSAVGSISSGFLVFTFHRA